MILALYCLLPDDVDFPIGERWSMCSGGSMGGAQGARLPLFWVKKEEMTEGKMADRASKSRLPLPPPPPPLAQALNPPLMWVGSNHHMKTKNGLHDLSTFLGIVLGLYCTCI